MKPTTCLIWGTPAEELSRIGHRREIISPRAGGRYAISDTVEATLKHRPLTEWEKIILAGWIADQRRQGEECPYISSDVLQAEIGRGG